jgi:copper chaperone CopZ
VSLPGSPTGLVVRRHITKEIQSMRFRSFALVALTTFVLAAGSAFACDKDAKTASAGSACGAKAASADAKVASSGAGCCAAGAKAASAGAGCSDAAKAASADAKVAGSGSACSGEKAAAAMVVYNVSGMTCGGCATKVEAAVANLKMDGVNACTVDVEKGVAVVTVADGKQVDSEKLAQAITAAGFPAEMQKAEAVAPEAEKATETSTM